MPDGAQTNRDAKFTSPLGGDVFLKEFSAYEGLSELFVYDVQVLASSTEKPDFDLIIGDSDGCTIEIDTYPAKSDGASDGESVARIFHGVLTDAQWLGAFDDDLDVYRLILRPWLSLLGRQADCRIFLNKTVLQIIKEVFDAAGFAGHYRDDTSGLDDTIEYCVQYRETDLAFVCRLMEHYGIYYFFEPSKSAPTKDKPSQGRHTMVMVNSRASHKPVEHLSDVTFNPGNTLQTNEQTIWGWSADTLRAHTGKISLNDYDYEHPNRKLLVSKGGGGYREDSKLEVYDYHYKYTDQGKGADLAQYRLEAEGTIDYRRSGRGCAPSLYPGGLVTLQKHPSPQENQQYLVVHASHRFTAQQYRSGGGFGSNQGYSGQYAFQPANRQFRSLPLTPKPSIYGIQTAKVVGKPGEDGEEISTDKYGRIWVKFHWDREPQKTCPIRVAQVWAGNKWGAMFVPRVGMEVVVDFIEGDPDRPLVTGCVYNGVNAPPYDLPANKTQSGWKSNTSTGGNGYNEFMFEDKKGGEFIRMHAQKDHDVTILNSETAKIGENFKTPKGSPSRQHTIKNGDDKLTIDKGNQAVTLKEGNQTITLEAGDRTVTLNVGQHTTDTVKGITLTVCYGASRITIMPESISIMSPTINITAEALVNINAPLVTIGEVVAIPELDAGAATVSGVPV